MIKKIYNLIKKNYFHSPLSKKTSLLKNVSFQNLLALNCLILLITSIQVGIGPFLSIYLKSELNWNPNQIGIALGVLNFGAMLNHIPSGLLIDAFKIKRLMLGCSCLIIAIACFFISQTSNFPSIIGIQFIIGLASAIIPTAIAAISLGLVGKKEFPTRQSKNESLGHASNIILASIAGLAAALNGNIWIIYSYAIFSFLGIFPIFFIKEDEINHNISRQSNQGVASYKSKKVVSIRKILIMPVNIIFLISVFLFHFSNASLLTLIGQIFVESNPKSYTLLMASSLIITHLIMMLVSLGLGLFIQKSNRKPLLLLTFIFTLIRGVLYTYSHNAYFILSLQLLDGISSGIFGVLSVIIITELTQNSGRFNFFMGLVALCQGIAYSISNVSSGFIANLYTYNVAFYTLSTFALFGFFLYFFSMPETLNWKNKY